MIDLVVLYHQYFIWVKAAIILLAGFMAAKVAAVLIGRTTSRQFGVHAGKIATNVVFYGLIGVTIITALGVFDVELAGFLAAAGIIGIAIGFAAQASVSNIISGFFLITDRPFEIGDAIEIDGLAGHVLDISLISTRLRTFDNRYVRLPNSSVANARIVNLSRYELRRLDLALSIAYREDLSRAMEIIDQVVRGNPNVLVDPEPQIYITRLGDSGVEFEVRAWIERITLFSTRTDLLKGIKNALDEAGIEIPFPHRKIYLGNEAKGRENHTGKEHGSSGVQ